MQFWGRDEVILARRAYRFAEMQAAAGVACGAALGLAGQIFELRMSSAARLKLASPRRRGPSPSALPRLACTSARSIAAQRAVGARQRFVEPAERLQRCPALAVRRRHLRKSPIARSQSRSASAGCPSRISTPARLK